MGENYRRKKRIQNDRTSQSLRRVVMTDRRKGKYNPINEILDCLKFIMGKFFFAHLYLYIYY